MCQTVSQQVHGYYTRTVQDLAWSTYSVQLEIRLCRFVCINTTCSRCTFAERLGEQLPAYARRTTRCKTKLQAIGLALGGKAGVRLAQILGISVSADTLLRLIRSQEVPIRETRRAFLAWTISRCAKESTTAQSWSICNAHVQSISYLIAKKPRSWLGSRLILEFRSSVVTARVPILRRFERPLPTPFRLQIVFTSRKTHAMRNELLSRSEQR